MDERERIIADLEQKRDELLRENAQLLKQAREEAAQKEAGQKSASLAGMRLGRLLRQPIEILTPRWADICRAVERLLDENDRLRLERASQECVLCQDDGELPSDTWKLIHEDCHTSLLADLDATRDRTSELTTQARNEAEHWRDLWRHDTEFEDEHDTTLPWERADGG